MDRMSNASHDSTNAVRGGNTLADAVYPILERAVRRIAPTLRFGKISTLERCPIAEHQQNHPNLP
jgi:hypothetical protein